MYLCFASSRLFCFSQQQSCVNTTREMVLESEVQDCHRIIFQLRQEKQGLELSVQVVLSLLLFSFFFDFFGLWYRN